MSWSTNAVGKPAEVKVELERQFSYPLSETGGLPDAGEKETVRKVKETIFQCLDTFDPESNVHVSACGHMGYNDWTTKAGSYQNVSLTIKPMPQV